MSITAYLKGNVMQFSNLSRMNTNLQEKIKKSQYLSGLFVRLIVNKRISIGKVKNFIINFSSALLHKEKAAELPSVIQIDPNNICNLHCTACPTGLGEHPKPKGQMPLEAFTKIVDEVKDSAFLIVLYNSGEPFLNKDIYKMIRYANDNNIAVITSTNGNLIAEEDKGEAIVKSGLDTLVISISGLTQDVYSKYHVGGDIEKVFDGISIITRKKRELKSKTPKIVLRLLLFDYNYQEIERWRSVIKEKKIEVDYFSPRMACKELQFADDLTDSFTTTAVDSSNESNGSNKNSHCYWLWMIPVVHWDGTVIPCCYINLRPPEMGNVFDHPEGVKGIWTGDKYRAMRRAVLRDKKSIPSCRECKSNPLGFQDSFNREMGFVVKTYRSKFGRKYRTAKEDHHA